MSNDDLEKITAEESERTIDLEKKLKNLENIISFKYEVLRLIAHDLRSPYSGLLGYTQLLVEEIGNSTNDDLLYMAIGLNNAMKEAYGFVESLLEYANLAYGGEELKFDKVNVYEISQSTKNLFKNQLEKKNIKLKIDNIDGTYVTGNEAMVASIIRNLVSNAIKFTPKDGFIYISGKEKPDNMYEISVQDTGIGMPESIKSKLFKPEPLVKRKGLDGEPSGGIGLLIVDELVKKNKGQIYVTSAENNGTTFKVVLPMYKD